MSAAKHPRRHSFDLLIVLVVFSVYAGSALLVSATGANVYRQTVEVMQDDFNLRTSIQYLTEKVRQNDVAGGVRIESQNGSDALVLTQEIVGRESFETWIFVSDGQLRETTIAAGTALSLDQTQAIMPLRDLRIDYDPNGLLDIRAVTVEGSTSETSIQVKSGVS
ncbi:MAG: DUF4860 domain-containing protein [Coriobacteriales bacterium]|jgi:hypothetical protein|nr:DUF4860 domain-containing protein [Coriobacteriales bacterium]